MHRLAAFVAKEILLEESNFGREGSRGEWSPNKPISYGPVFTWPPKPRALLSWFLVFLVICFRGTFPTLSLPFASGSF